MSLAEESLGLDHESRKELKNSRAIQEHRQDKKAPGLGMMPVALIPALRRVSVNSRPALSTAARAV